MSTRLVSAALTMAALIILPAAASAQAPTTFGIKGGLNLSTLAPESGSGLDTSSIWGATAGIFVGRGLSDNLSVQVEGLFSQKGAQDDTNGAATKIRLTYFTVPVLLRYGPTSTNDTHFHVFTGPEIGFKINAEGKDDVFGPTDLDDEVKSTDFGWTVGAGVEKGPVTLDARYTFGLVNINAAPSDPGVKNRTFSILAGYRFK